MTGIFYLNKFFLKILFVLLANQAVLAQFKADTWATAKQKGTANLIFTYIKAPGFSYKNAQNNLEGICIDIVKNFINYIKATKGVVIKAKIMDETVDFNKFLNDIKTASGGVFGLGNITITEARKKEMSFTPPYINNLAFLITHSSVTTLASLRSIGTQFQGMKAYTVKGTTNEKYILDLKAKYFPTMQIAYVATSGAVLAKVAADNKSFTHLDFNYYAEALKYGSSIKRHPVGDVFSEDFGFIMPLNSDWQPLWEEFFIQYGFIRSIEYRKILNKHLGASAVNALDKYKD